MTINTRLIGGRRAKLRAMKACKEPSPLGPPLPNADSALILSASKHVWLGERARSGVLWVVGVGATYVNSTQLNSTSRTHLVLLLLQPLALAQEHEEPLLDTDRDFTMSIS